MTPKERVIAALRHIEPDRVPKGENGVDGRLVEQILGRQTLLNMDMKDLEALWDRRREEVRYAIRHAEPGGGLVITNSNVIQPGTQLENYYGMRSAIREYGR